MKKSLLFLLALFVFSFVLLGCAPQQSIPTATIPEEIESPPEKTEQKDTMIFIVNVPENTPEEDIIYIHPYGSNQQIKMEKIGKFTHKVVLKPQDISFVANYRGTLIWYRYNRNKWGFVTAEYMKPDTNDFYWTKRGREVVWSPGSVQEDTVIRWRWFPDGPVITEDTSSLQPEKFQPRINDIRFRSGQGIQDLHIGGFEDFYTTTAEHMREVGYEWVVLFPAWQWIEQDPLPKLNNDLTSNPKYPDDILLKQIKDYREKGIKVIVAPQICCTEIKIEDRSKEWWQAYWKEVERFLVHHAELAERGGAESLVADVAFIGITNQYGEDIQKLEQDGWSDAWETIREIYSGEIGQMVWNFGSKYGGLTPEAEFITWADQLDFFYVQSEAELSDKSNPTDQELLEGVNRELDIIQTLYDTHKKPFIIQTGLFAEKESWKGFIPGRLEGSGCGESDTEDGCEDGYSGIDQARAIHGYFMGIKNRPWIIGYTQFGYEQYILPRQPGWSIRARAGEDVWRKWNEVIYNE